MKRFLHQGIVAVAAVFGVASCATPPTALLPKSTMTATTVDGAAAFAAPAAWTVRRTHDDRERVITLAGYGEVIVDAADRCRLVRSATTVQAVDVLPGPDRCASVVGERLCLEQVAFGQGPRAVVVHGCAEANALFLDRVSGDTGATIGPRHLIERCVPLAAEATVSPPLPAWLRVSAITVDDNPDPWRDVHLRYDADGFAVCFVSGKEGRYTIVVDVEDPAPRQVTLSGDVRDL